MAQFNGHVPFTQPRIRRTIVRNLLRTFVYFSLDAMQRLTRLLAVLFFGLFGGGALLICYSSYRAQQAGLVSVERGNDFPGSWIVLVFFTLFGIALCILSVYCLLTPHPVGFKFTLVPSAPRWVGLMVFAAMVVFMLVAFITALRHVIHGI